MKLSVQRLDPPFPPGDPLFFEDYNGSDDVDELQGYLRDQDKAQLLFSSPSFSHYDLSVFVGADEPPLDSLPALDTHDSPPSTSASPSESPGSPSSRKRRRELEPAHTEASQRPIKRARAESAVRRVSVSPKQAMPARYQAKRDSIKSLRDELDGLRREFDQQRDLFARVQLCDDMAQDTNDRIMPQLAKNDVATLRSMKLNWLPLFYAFMILKRHSETTQNPGQWPDGFADVPVGQLAALVARVKEHRSHWAKEVLDRAFAAISPADGYLMLECWLAKAKLAADRTPGAHPHSTRSQAYVRLETLSFSPAAAAYARSRIALGLKNKEGESLLLPDADDLLATLYQ